MKAQASSQKSSMVRKRTPLAGRAIARFFVKAAAQGSNALHESERALVIMDNASLHEALAIIKTFRRPVVFLYAGARAYASRWARVPGMLPVVFMENGGLARLREYIALCHGHGSIPCVLRLDSPLEALISVARATHSTTFCLQAGPLDVPDWSRDFKAFRLRPDGRIGLFWSYGIPPSEASTDSFQRAALGQSVVWAEAHRATRGHLGTACVRQLKRYQFKKTFIDTFQNGKAFSGGMLLAAAWRLAEWMRHEIPEQRVGIVLPPGLGGAAANLACALADKTPVNLNFTMGASANEAAIRNAGLRTIITSDAFVRRIEGFPWPERRVDLASLLKSLGRMSILFKRLEVLLLPWNSLRARIGVPPLGGNKEAGLLFTSGSVGEPKGVVLTHRNLIANVAQCQAILPRDLVPSIVGCLPLFHSFGFTVTLWWPMLGGPSVFTHVSPLDAARILELIERYKAALLVTTPTFLRSYLRKAKGRKLADLRLVVTGAEKLQPSLAKEFEETTGIPVCEGYGATETSPVVSVNLPDGSRVNHGVHPSVSRRLGSAGRIAPGLEVRVQHPDTGEVLPLSSTGLLSFRGPNIFACYLNNPEQTAKVLQEGWYSSGDLGRMDSEGFLTIEGRLSRFSKIGGEMVPHGEVERVLQDYLRAAFGDEAQLTVTSLMDESKGEALVVLTTRAFSAERARDVIAKANMPNLWVPRLIFQVEKIPVLASGKVDLKSCRKMAKELVEPLSLSAQMQEL